MSGNIYNQTISEKEPLDVAIQRFIEYWCNYNVHVALPVRVEKYNAENQTVDCIRMIRSRNNINGAMDDPGKALLCSIPVQFHASDTDIFSAIPIKKGTLGTVVFFDKSIDNYIQSDGSSVVDDSLDPRGHDLSDAFFMPGIFPFKKNLDGNSETDWVMRNKNMKITLDPTGRISIEGATQEVITVISDFMDHAKTLVENLLGSGIIVNGVTVGGGSANGQFDPATIAKLTIDMASFVSDKTKLDTVKI